MFLHALLFFLLATSVFAAPAGPKQPKQRPKTTVAQGGDISKPSHQALVHDKMKDHHLGF